MSKKNFLLISLSAFLLVSFGLRADNIVDEIVARVNDQIITHADLEHAKVQTEEELKQRFPSDWQAKWNEQQKDVLRDLIDQQLLLDKGKELGINADTELVKRLNQLRQQMGLGSIDDLEKEAQKQGVSFEDFKDQIRNNVITQRVIGQEVGSHIHITDAEVQDWYNKHQSELSGEEEVNLSEILVSTQPQNVQAKEGEQPKALPEDPAQVTAAEAKAKGLVEQLRKGAKFEDLAKSSSDGQTASQGGTLGSFKRGELAKDLEDKTFGLKPGEFTDAIRTRQGFIILKVNGRRAAGVPPMKDIEDKIKEAIYTERLDPAARAYLGKLREQAYIDIKSGFVDTGGGPNQSNKPVLLAAANTTGGKSGKNSGHLKKKKRFLVF